MKTWIMLAALCAVLDQALAEPLVITKRGYAEDAGSGELIYIEEHERVIDNGQTVTHTIRYRDPQGDIFAQKQLEFSDDYQRPFFSMVDERRDYREGLRSTDAGLEVFSYRRGDNRSAVLKQTEFVADAGFDRVVENRWDELVDGKTLKFDFLVPARSGTVKFRLKKTGMATYEGKSAVELTLAPANALVRWLVDPIVVLYDAEEKALLKYRGISNLRGPNYKNYNVVIHFPPEEWQQQPQRVLAQNANETGDPSETTGSAADAATARP
ncbi:MAG: hypothetical protein AAGA23_11400 [Pseudomonadota bacterium]